MRYLVTIAAALAVLAPVAARAQADAPPPDAMLRLGQLFVTPALELKELGIDSNVFNDASGRRDFTVTLAPAVEVVVPFARRARLTANGGADMVYYQTYATERSIDPGLTARGEVYLNRVTLFAEPTYVRTRQRLNFELDARARREERGLGMGVAVHVTRALTVEVSGREGRVAFDAGEVFEGTELQETLNRGTLQVAARARLELTPLTSVAIRADRSSDRFEFSPGRDASSLRITPGVEFRPGALISGSAYVGVRRFTPASDRLEGFHGLVADAALEYTWRDSTRVSVNTNRDVSYSYEPLQPYYVTRGYGLSVERKLVGPTDVTLGLARHRHAYREFESSLAPADARVDSVRTLSASFGYRFAREARIGFGVLHRSRQSNTSSRGYEGTRAAFTANYGF
jgi:hypothetical protein